MQVQGPGAGHYIKFTDSKTPSVEQFEVVNLYPNGWERVGDVYN